MRSKLARFGLVMAGLTLAGCATVGPDFQRPTASLPARWQTEAQPAADAALEISRDVRWWQTFNDAELSALLERVTAANFDVRLASSRWLQARAARRIRGADAQPEVTAAASYQRARSSQNGLLDSAGLDGKQAFNLWQTGVDATWELDLWGRVRREIESADASVEVSADLRRGVLLAVYAETARDYLQLRGVQVQQTIVRQNLDIARQNLQLTQIRLAAGVATRLETAEASARISAIEARLPVLENERRRLVNALSFLLGAAPHALEPELQTGPATLAALPLSVPLGLPSELAERRPDIRAAEARLHAATADIGVAVGDFYPRITLSADLGLQALRFADLDQWGSRTFGVGPALSVPIFEGGRLKGQVALRQAQQQAALIEFQRTVLTAWHEVDDALGDYAARQQAHARLAATVQQDQIALDNAQRQYVAGATDFLQVLTVQRDLLAAQLALADSATAVSMALVSLYTALGGGWETTFPLASAGPVASAITGPAVP
ncbi:efflux transporter outer membrane subunit [Silvimonas sp. JCM 19000]